MRNINRKSAPKVKSGRVQKKNNQTETGDYYNAQMPWLVIDRKRPGRGYKHLVSAADIKAFLQLVPQWEEFEGWLEAIVLEPGNDDYFGTHCSGIITLSAWPKDLRIAISISGLKDEKPLLDMLGVPYTIDEKRDWVECQFTEETARGHQLLGTLLHEIGHHIDRLTTRSKVKSCRGEPFAKNYAWETAKVIFNNYCRTFAL
jgi:hypothetical protein